MNKTSSIGLCCSMLCLLSTVLVGCGGSDEDATSAKSSTANLSNSSSLQIKSIAQSSPIEIIDTSTSSQPKVLAAALVEGDVANEIKNSLPAANEHNYDILLIDQKDNLDQSTQSKVKAALNADKKVVIDLGPSGIIRQTRTEAVKNIVGMGIDADAVMIQNSPDQSGYFITPIEAKSQKNLTAASVKKSPSSSSNSNQTASSTSQNDQQLNSQSEQATSVNTVQSIFGL